MLCGTGGGRADEGSVVAGDGLVFLLFCVVVFSVYGGSSACDMVRGMKAMKQEHSISRKQWR